MSKNSFQPGNNVLTILKLELDKLMTKYLEDSQTNGGCLKYET